MPELVQMAKSQFRSPLLVENHVGDALDFAMTSDCHHGKTETFFENRIDENESLNRTFHQQTRIFLDEIGLAAMAGRQIEIALLDEKLLHAGKHLGGIAVAQLGDKNTDREGLALAQRPRVEAGPVIELGRCFDDPVASLLRNGT